MVSPTKRKLPCDEGASGVQIGKKMRGSLIGYNHHLLKMHELISNFNREPPETSARSFSLSSHPAAEVEGEKKEKEAKSESTLTGSKIELSSFRENLEAVDEKTLGTATSQSLFRRIYLIAIEKRSNRINRPT